MISAIFDDHYEAFVTWRENGLKGLTCIHVDAHLDVMSKGFNKASLEGIASATNGDELSQFRGNPRLPWGGFHCGNYLFPALIDGTIKELIWVVPPHVIGGENFVDGVRQECQNWLDLRLEEYQSLKGDDCSAIGELEGRTFVVCTAEALPELTDAQKQNLALDIDVDYFVRNSDDSIWQTPHELYRLLGKPEPTCLTVAYSVDGGYTPIQERYLGPVTVEIFSSKDDKKWEEETQEVLRVDKLEGEGREEVLSEFLKVAPDCIKPALLWRQGKREEAAVLDSEYQERIQNIIARHLIKKEHDEGLELLADVTSEDPETLYLRSYLSLDKGDSVTASRNLRKLLENPELEELERSRVLILAANAALGMGQAKECLKFCEEALEIESKSSEIFYLKANALRSSGRLKEGAKAMRKALRYAKGRVSSLPMLLDAARIYDEMGQSALAKSTRRELKEKDVTGRYVIKAMLDASKL